MPSPEWFGTFTVMKDEASVAGAGRVVARLSRVVDRALGDAGLTLPQYRVLAFLAEGSAAASVLAGTLAVSRPAVTTLVDGLVAKGLVGRSACAEDRRRVDHVLTDSGADALRQADEAGTAALGRVAEHLEPADQARAFDGLALWGEALDRARAAFLHETAGARS